MTNIEELVRLAKARLAELDRETSHLRGLIDIYEPKLRDVEAVSGAARVPLTSRPSRGGRRNRSISPAWTAILRFIGESGEANYDAMEAFAASQGLQVSRNNLRSQMAVYHARGMVESRGNGVWALSDNGRAKIGLRNGSAGVQQEQPAHSSTFESEGDPLTPRSMIASLNPNAAEEAEEVSGVLATTR
jgi:hypothetical protein